MDTIDRILVAAARINKREDQLTRTTRAVRTRNAKFIDFDRGVFEPLF
jgi:hypothetical protein